MGALSNREGNETQASERAADRAPAAKMNERYEANCEVQHQQRTLLRKFTKTLLRVTFLFFLSSHSIDL